QMFLGGILPGCVMVVLAIWWGVAAGPKHEVTGKRFVAREALRATWEAKWELLLPVVALVALFGGFATPVEAAAVTALYAFIIETCVYRDLRWCSGRRLGGNAETTDAAGTAATTTV